MLTTDYLIIGSGAVGMSFADQLLTDTEHEPIIEQRFAAIKQGFDRIRGRTPRR